MGNPLRDCTSKGFHIIVIWKYLDATKFEYAIGKRQTMQKASIRCVAYIYKNM